jgi:hypothetical protein
MVVRHWRNRSTEAGCPEEKAVSEWNTAGMGRLGKEEIT